MRRWAPNDRCVCGRPAWAAARRQWVAPAGVGWSDVVHGVVCGAVCGVLREEEMTFLFGEKGLQVGSVAAVPLRYNNLYGILAIGNADPNFYKSSMGFHVEFPESATPELHSCWDHLKI